MADVIKTIGGTTPDYATWALFLAAVPSDITTATGTDEHWIGKGRDGVYSEDFGLTGITTDSTNRVTLTYDSGGRNDGRSRAVSGAGCSIVGSATTGTIRHAIQYVSIVGIEISSTLSRPAINFTFGTFTAGANETLLDSCVIHNTGSSTNYLIAASVANLNAVLNNVTGYGGSRVIDTRLSSSAEIDYCTFWQHTDQLGVVSDSELTCRNTYAGRSSGTSECFYTGAAAPSGSNNASSDTTATIDYTNSVNSVAGASTFVSVTAGSEDFTKLASTSLAGAGVAIAGITTDIIGNTRGTPPDIGAFEDVGGPAANYLPLILQQSM